MSLTDQLESYAEGLSELRQMEQVDVEARVAALRDAIKDVCAHCSGRATGYDKKVIRNDVGNYVHEHLTQRTAWGETRQALCVATPIHARLAFEAQRQRQRNRTASGD